MGIDDRGRWELHPVLEETDETPALQVCEESKEFSEPVAV
jgi:hypothetical protein